MAMSSYGEQTEASLRTLEWLPRVSVSFGFFLRELLLNFVSVVSGRLS